MRADARAWAASPALAALRRRLAALPDGAPGWDVAATAVPLLDDIGWVTDAIRRCVARMARDPWHQPPFRTLPHGRRLGFVLVEAPRLRITLARVPLEGIALHKAAGREEGRPRSVTFTGLATRTRVIRSGGALLQLWECPPAGADFTLARAGRCRRAGRLALVDGQCFAIDGRSEAWTVMRQEGDLLLLQASASGPEAPLAIEYGGATGDALSASATDGAAARMQLMATLLRQMGRADAAPAIACAAGEGPFFLRWHLLRELAALDRGAALPLLQAAASDNHPERARAARQAAALLAA